MVRSSFQLRYRYCLQYHISVTRTRLILIVVHLNQVQSTLYSHSIQILSYNNNCVRTSSGQNKRAQRPTLTVSSVYPPLAVKQEISNKYNNFQWTD